MNAPGRLPGVYWIRTETHQQSTTYQSVDHWEKLPPTSDETFQFWTQLSQRPSKHQIPVQSTLPLQCGPGRTVPDGEKVRVRGTKTILASAFQEHRTGQREVRVIAVALRRETVAYHCRLCCQDRLHGSIGVGKILISHYDFAYGTAHIMCPLPSDCDSPTHIAVTSAEGDSEDEPDEFLEVKNRVAKSDSFPYNFVICISTMFEFSNVLQLVQSLEMLQLLGVNRVAVYKTSNSPETQRLLDYYTHKGFIEVIPWNLSRFLTVSRNWLPHMGPGDLHYFGQIPALNDCIYRYMYQSRYLALHDIDELILPQSVDSWSELVPLLEQKHGADKCYSFENNVFPNTVILPPPDSHSLLLESIWCPGTQSVPGVNILAHLYQEPIIPEARHSNGKLIINPRAVFSPDIHILAEAEVSCSWVDRETARLYHTRSPKQTELTPEKLIYDGRLLNYSTRLIPAVCSVLTESGLLPG